MEAVEAESEDLIGKDWLTGEPIAQEAPPSPATHAILRSLKAGGKVCQMGEQPKTI